MKIGGIDLLHPNSSSRKLPLVSALLLIVPMLLAACGDATPTTVPAAATAAGTTAAATSAATTAAAVTTAAGITTPAASATTAAAGTATTAAAAGASNPGAGVEPPVVPAGKMGGIMKYGLSSDPSGLDPQLHTGAAPAIIKTLVYDTLTHVAPDGKPLPWLATGWESADPQNYTFKLRSGVKWHDGTDFTADDVKFSYERIGKKETGATRFPDFSNIDTITVVDPLTVKIVLKKPDASFLTVIADVTSSIVSKKFVEAGNDLKTKMMGTGAFTFAARENGVKIDLKKNPNFWLKGQPYLDGISFIMYPDDRARLSALQSGAVDFADYIPWRSYDELAGSSNFAVYSKPATTSALYFNTTKPPFDNVKLRQAVSYAIDPAAIAKAVFFGKAVPASQGFLISGTKYAEGQTTPYKFDVAKAKAMVAESGYTGQEITLVTTSTYDFLQQTAEIIQNELTAIGLKVKLDSVDFTVFGTKFNGKDFNLLTSSFSAAIPDPNYMTSLFAKGSLYGNRTGFVDQKIDDLLTKGRSTLVEADRLATYQELNQLVLNELPILPLVNREEGEAGAKYVKNYVRYGTGVYVETNRSLLTVWMEK
jgi:peptide/nickel transport system substrate-binding protein